MKNNMLKNIQPKNKKGRLSNISVGKKLLSPIKFIIFILIVWVIGIVLGVGINLIIMKFINFDTNIQYVFLVLAFILASAIIAMPIMFLITRSLTKITNYVNENIDRVANGDYTVKLNHITKNPHINNSIDNFNKMIKQLNSVSILKNDFISGFSHEFKTPIVSIKGYAELLLDANNLDKEQKEYLKIIVDESHRLSKLSENVMMLASLDSQSIITNKKAFSLNGQIENCVLLLDGKLKAKNIDLTLDLDEAIIESDPDLVKEIWINLLYNSIKYVNYNGKIAISLKTNDDSVVVKIIDDGVGMTEETKKHIFDKFYQGDKSHYSKGIGLGLTIVSRILEIIGGKIECESQLNLGTTMTVVLNRNNSKLINYKII